MTAVRKIREGGCPHSSAGVPGLSSLSKPGADGLLSRTEGKGLTLVNASGSPRMVMGRRSNKASDCHGGS